MPTISAVVYCGKINNPAITRMM